MTLPIERCEIIQGGMGVGVSDWRLAREVSRLGGLGVVAGTLQAEVMCRRLQDGDPGGAMRRGLAAFPIRRIADDILGRWFSEGGRARGAPYKSLPMPSLSAPRHVEELTVAANFTEIFLAKEGHEGLVGINLLEKVTLPNLPSLYGAILAGVDAVLMGAGIPREIPGCLDALALHAATSLTWGPPREDGAKGRLEFNPSRLWGEASPPPLKRPFFLAIVSSATLATMLAKKAHGRVDGFVVEGPTAGGHNAPPRGIMEFNEKGEPVYGSRDAMDYEALKELGLPFWIAGSVATKGGLQAARILGASGIQVGSAFAFCEESGLRPDLRRRVLSLVREGAADVLTDPRASPTGFPFKVVGVPGTLSEPEVYGARERVCDLGYLREPFSRDDGTLGYRCPGEPVSVWVAKGGDASETRGRKCLCNALLSNIGLGQTRQGIEELPLLTGGDDVRALGRFLGGSGESYSARDVMESLTGKLCEA